MIAHRSSCFATWFMRMIAREQLLCSLVDELTIIITAVHAAKVLLQRGPESPAERLLVEAEGAANRAAAICAEARK